MNVDAFLRPRARRDLEVAAAWYEDRREELGSEFIDEFLLCVDRIESNPEGYSLDAEVRRALLHRFPIAYAKSPPVWRATGGFRRPYLQGNRC